MVGCMEGCLAMRQPSLAVLVRLDLEVLLGPLKKEIHKLIGLQYTTIPYRT